MLIVMEIIIILTNKIIYDAIGSCKNLLTNKYRISDGILKLRKYKA